VTLREANRSLQDAGYIESRRGRGGGTFVVKRPTSSTATGDPGKLSRLTIDDAQDAIALRRVLEVGATELAAGRRHREEACEQLWSLVRACTTCSIHDYRPTDSRFHLAIAELAGVPSLTAAIADVRQRINELLDAIPLLPPIIENSNRQHVAIVDAILAGDVAAAGREMSEHVGATASRWWGTLQAAHESDAASPSPA
jgi:DNA-binding FadR family transcriptional regulator